MNNLQLSRIFRILFHQKENNLEPQDVFLNDITVIEQFPIISLEENHWKLIPVYEEILCHIRI